MRSAAIFRRKAIYEELHPETKHGGDRKSDQVANSATRFTANTADTIGKSCRSVEIAAAKPDWFAVIDGGMRGSARFKRGLAHRAKDAAAEECERYAWHLSSFSA